MVAITHAIDNSNDDHVKSRRKREFRKVNWKELK